MSNEGSIFSLSGDRNDQKKHQIRKSKDKNKYKDEKSNNINEGDNVNGIQSSSAIQVGSQLSLLKEKLEVASLKIVELRGQIEQAVNRAELAEKGKAELEDKLRRQREHRHRRRAALAALQEVSTPTPFTPSTSLYGTPKTYQLLGNVLNIKL
ncbi:hypothetical protein RJT34_12375 [Clitoria ternatea]|uniref:Uncharacterized protein n=1 Tax=Clitoria ternatea TaxID=43366 RepID=A0AAN9JQ70_CLITE